MSTLTILPILAWALIIGGGLVAYTALVLAVASRFMTRAGGLGWRPARRTFKAGQLVALAPEPRTPIGVSLGDGRVAIGHPGGPVNLEQDLPPLVGVDTHPKAAGARFGGVRRCTKCGRGMHLVDHGGECSWCGATPPKGAA